MNKCVVYLARFLRAVLFLACLKSRGFCGGVDSDSGDGGDLLTSTIPLTASWMFFIIGYTIRIDSFS